MMDRNKADELPKLQCGFIDFVCSFVYKVGGHTFVLWFAGSVSVATGWALMLLLSCCSGVQPLPRGDHAHAGAPPQQQERVERAEGGARGEGGGAGGGEEGQAGGG